MYSCISRISIFLFVVFLYFYILICCIPVFLTPVFLYFCIPVYRWVVQQYFCPFLAFISHDCWRRHEERTKYWLAPQFFSSFSHFFCFFFQAITFVNFFLPNFFTDLLALHGLLSFVHLEISQLFSLNFSPLKTALIGWLEIYKNKHTIHFRKTNLKIKDIKV